MINKKKSRIVFLAVFFNLVLCQNVFSENDDVPNGGLQVAPLHYNWKMNSGDVRVNEITVRNFSDESRNIEVSVEDFYVSNDSKQANFYVPDEDHELVAYDVINWISVPDNFVLQPGEVKRLQFSVAVPDGQPTSGYYGSIFFKTDADDAVVEGESGKSVRLDVSYRVGTLVTLAVQGEDDMNISGVLEKLNVSRLIYGKGPIEIYARLKSEGNVHYQASGRMEVYKFGKKFATIMMGPEIMYPGKVRTFIERVPFEQFDHGVYSAKLEMQSEDGSVVFDDEIPFFIVLPWKSTALIVCGVAFVIMLVRLFKRKYKIVKNENPKNNE